MNTDTSTLRYAVTNDLCLVGDNPEMSEMGNPRGDLEGLAHYIVAEAPDGRRFAHNAVAFTINGWVIEGTDEVDDDPEYPDLNTFRVDSCGMTVERLEALATHLNTFTPSLDAAHWNEVQACYGSEAYVRGGWEGRALSLEIDEAADAGELTFHQASALKVERGLLS